MSGGDCQVGAGQHTVAAKVADVLKADIGVIDCSLVLCGYRDDPKSIAQGGKYNQLFGRNELKLCILDTLREAPADDETIARRVIECKGGTLTMSYGQMC